MKRILAACFAGALIFAGLASAATPAQRIAKLEKQVSTLTKTIKTQTKQIKQLQNLTAGALFIETCLAATTLGSKGGLRPEPRRSALALDAFLVMLPIGGLDAARSWQLGAP